MEEVKSSDAAVTSSNFDDLKNLLFPDMSLDEVAEKYSPRVDEVIAKNEADDLKFSAGKFKIACVDDKSFALSYELYFQDADKNWIKVANTTSAMDPRLWLSKEAWEELLDVKEKFYDVAAPEFDTNGKVDF